jgi:hypothetical protein
MYRLSETRPPKRRKWRGLLEQVSLVCFGINSVSSTCTSSVQRREPIAVSEQACGVQRGVPCSQDQAACVAKTLLAADEAALEVQVRDLRDNAYTQGLASDESPAWSVMLTTHVRPTRGLEVWASQRDCQVIKFRRWEIGPPMPTGGGAPSNNRMQATVGAVTARAQGARSAPAQPAPDCR